MLHSGGDPGEPTGRSVGAVSLRSWLSCVRNLNKGEKEKKTMTKVLKKSKESADNMTCP